MSEITPVIFGISAIAFNLLIAGIFIAQKKGDLRMVRKIGSMVIALSLPFGYVLYQNLMEGGNIWARVALAVVLAYQLVELLMDYLLKIDFRSKWVTHVPYILLEYAAFAGLIYTAFTISDFWGWTVSVTFWVAMAALLYLMKGREKSKK